MFPFIRIYSPICYLTFLCCFVGMLSGYAQDSVKASGQTQATMHVMKSPKKAALYSTMLPGLGQAYNHKYWKIPVIYAGFAGLGYAFYFNQSNYVVFRDALRYRLDNDSTTTDAFPAYSVAVLTDQKDYYHRYRDLTCIGMIALYVLNIIDASVDAHLYTFDVSDELSLRVEPYIQPSVAHNSGITGLSLQIRF